MKLLKLSLFEVTVGEAAGEVEAPDVILLVLLVIV